jgi:hypothetical protein
LREEIDRTDDEQQKRNEKKKFEANARACADAKAGRRMEAVWRSLMQSHAALSGLRQKTPEEQDAQDQKKRDDDNLDEAHSQFPLSRRDARNQQVPCERGLF